MKVAKNDDSIKGLLEEEYRRCLEILPALTRKLEAFPKGALNNRRKSYNGKEYTYHYLVSRNGSNVINKHVSEAELPELMKTLEQRDKCKKELQTYKTRIAYLEKLLRLPARKESGE